MKNFHIHRLRTKFRSTPISTTCFKTIKIKNMSQWFNGKKSKLYYKVGGQIYSVMLKTISREQTGPTATEN